MDEFFNTDTGGMVDYGPALDIGPQTGGTYDIPTEAQPNNRPWDVAGGSNGQYGSDVMGILKEGIGAWSRNQQTGQLLDYKRYEATAGGVFRQGYPTMNPATGKPVAAGNNNMLLVLLAIGFVMMAKA